MRMIPSWKIEWTCAIRFWIRWLSVIILESYRSIFALIRLSERRNLRIARSTMINKTVQAASTLFELAIISTKWPLGARCSLWSALSTLEVVTTLFLALSEWHSWMMTAPEENSAIDRTNAEMNFRLICNTERTRELYQLVVLNPVPTAVKIVRRVAL